MAQKPLEQLTATERVKAAAAFFAERVSPNWRDRIDTARLDMISFDNCAACMVTGKPSYGAACRVLGIDQDGDTAKRIGIYPVRMDTQPGFDNEIDELNAAMIAEVRAAA